MVWKILGGLLIGAVLIFVVGGYFVYKKVRDMSSGPAVVEVTIAAPPERVFATLAGADSVALWMAGANALDAHGGLLRPGDLISVRADGHSSSAAGAEFHWRVSGVVPGTVLARELRPDTGTSIMVTRRDSIVARGDSTAVITTFSAPGFAGADTSKATQSSVASMAARVLLMGFTAGASSDLKRLKRHIEGATTTGADTSKTPQGLP
jgi:uncharacterized protein YndB with AHSA1/START domain